MTDKKPNAHGCMCASEPQNFGGYATGGFASPKPGEIPAIVWPEYTVQRELYERLAGRHKPRPPRYWYTRKIDHGTMIVCRLGGEHDTDALELAHMLGAAQLREHYDSRWLILNAIQGLERNAARLPVSTVTVHVSGHPRLSPEGCNRSLAPGQWWSFCGETDMGQTLPALCTECGGKFKLREP